MTHDVKKDDDRRHDRFCDDHKLLLRDTKQMCEKIAALNTQHTKEVEKLEGKIDELIEKKVDKDQHKGVLSIITTFGILIIGALIALNIRFGTITGEIEKAIAVEQKTIELLEKNLKAYADMQHELTNKFLRYERVK